MGNHRRSFTGIPGNEESSSDSSIANPRSYVTPSAFYEGLHPSKASPLLENLNLGFSGTRKASTEHGFSDNPSPPGSNDYRSRASDGGKRSASPFDRSAVEFGPRTGGRGMLGGITKSSSPFGDLDHSSRSSLFHRLSNQCNFTALRSLTKLYDSRTRKRLRNRLPAADGTSVPPVSNGMLLQPDTHPITEEQLVNKVRCQHCLKKISRTLCDAGKNVALWNSFIFRAIET